MKMNVFFSCLVVGSATVDYAHLCGANGVRPRSVDFTNWQVRHRTGHEHLNDPSSGIHRSIFLELRDPTT